MFLCGSSPYLPKGETAGMSESDPILYDKNSRRQMGILISVQSLKIAVRSTGLRRGGSRTALAPESADVPSAENCLSYPLLHIFSVHSPALSAGLHTRCFPRAGTPAFPGRFVNLTKQLHFTKFRSKITLDTLKWVRCKMKKHERSRLWNRRHLLRSLLAVNAGIALNSLFSGCVSSQSSADVFIGKAGDYNAEIASLIRSGFHELNVSEEEIRGKRILLKANIVEPHLGREHIVTHPTVVLAAAEAFSALGAAEIIVAEGAGHCRDTYRILEESRFDTILGDPKIKFIDLNYDAWQTAPNAGGKTHLRSFFLPATLKQVDWIVSMPKIKTHHWAGVTLSMKNLFGVLPGSFYGWPKNVLHTAGIINSIVDINATVRPHFAIADGIVGMQGDGPIMGSAKKSGIIVMGRNLPAVDATCARCMGINPGKVEYLAAVDQWLGPIRESRIRQRGESWKSVRTDFQLLDFIEAHRGLRL
jgi:uncharacterized protein (DUF362 family)